MFSGRPRRLAVGEDERRAQSRGEWPGVRSTARRGLAGGVVCVGGGASPLEGGRRFGRGEREFGRVRLDVGCGCSLRVGGPRARCAELAAGKRGTGGRDGGEVCLFEDGAFKVNVGAVGVVFGDSISARGGD